MKTLISKEAPNYSAEIVEHNGEKFKIVSENGNSYWHVKIFVLTLNKDYQPIANEFEIPNTDKVSYISNPEERIKGNRQNLEACKKFIKTVYK